MFIIKGSAKWAKIFTPETKFNPDGEYSIKVVMPEEEAVKIAEQLEEIRDEHFNVVKKDNPKVAKSLKVREVYEKETDEEGNDTGNAVFNCKMKATITSKKTGKSYEQKVAVVDAKRFPVSNLNVGNGSVVKVAVEPTPYYVASSKEVGVTLRLKAVQILELKEFGNAASIFDEEEGYMSKAEADNTPFDTADEEGDF